MNGNNNVDTRLGSTKISRETPLGMGLFLRYAEGCWMYMHEKGMVSEADNGALASGRPSHEVLKRVFYVAIPIMERIAAAKGKQLFDLDVLREFYSGEHNERKFREGELACLAFPVKVLEKKGASSYFVDMEPVLGKFWVESDLDLKPGDWAVMHRITLVEQVPERFALEMAGKLRKLGMDKTYKFPKVAIKYLKRLKRPTGLDGSKSLKGKAYGMQGIKEMMESVDYDKENRSAHDKGRNEAREHHGRPQEAAVQGYVEAYA